MAFLVAGEWRDVSDAINTGMANLLSLSLMQLCANYASVKGYTDFVCNGVRWLLIEIWPFKAIRP